MYTLSKILSNQYDATLNSMPYLKLYIFLILSENMLNTLNISCLNVQCPLWNSIHAVPCLEMSHKQHHLFT